MCRTSRWRRLNVLSSCPSFRLATALPVQQEEIPANPNPQVASRSKAQRAKHHLLQQTLTPKRMLKPSRQNEFTEFPIFPLFETNRAPMPTSPECWNPALASRYRVRRVIISAFAL